MVGKRLRLSLSFGVAIAALTVSPALAGATGPRLPDGPNTLEGLQQEDLRSLSLEELMNLEVTSVSRTSENLFRAPAAVYVITSEEIRRSGHRTLPEMLRLVPGMEVARIDANTWAVTARGFNARYANKLLVLIDGRTVYTPLFSGVFWEAQNLLPENIDRIEVIRGPGGTLWGANAVNGVINIITKDTAETTGWFAEAGAGSEPRGFAGVRFGGSGETVGYRAWARFFDHGAYTFADGTDADDDWRVLQGGFRVDWNPGADDEVALSGEMYEGEAGQTVVNQMTLVPEARIADLAGGHLLADWQHSFAGGSTSDLHVYYDRARRLDYSLETRDTFDVDFQHALATDTRHEIVWGAGYRVTSSSGLSPAQFPGEGRTLNLYSAFVQDQIALTPSWTLIVGSKFEHNDFTGFEVQPNARFSWSQEQRYAVWGAVSRAVRTPSEGEVDSSILLSGGTDPGTGLPIVLAFQGGRDLSAEKLIAYEAGFRTQPAAWLSLDVATFFNDYSDLIQAITLTPTVQFSPPPPRIIQPIVGANVAAAESYGVELNSRWQAHPRVQIGATYSYFELELVGSPNFDQIDESGASPRHQFKLETNVRLPREVELDGFLYYVGELESLDVDSYARLDLRLAWRPARSWELTLVAQNLIAGDHYEFVSSQLGELATQVQPSVYALLQWRR